MPASYGNGCPECVSGPGRTRCPAGVWWVLLGVLAPLSVPALPLEVRSLDGSGNNLVRPRWGAVDTPLLRLVEADYADGVSAPAGPGRPSARLISHRIARLAADRVNDRNLSSFVWQWGQFIDHDLDLTDPMSPREPLDIAVPTGDPWFDPDGQGDRTIAFDRSAYDTGSGTGTDNPRRQINQVSTWIDGSHIYGSDSHRAAALRTFAGGRLNTGTGDLLPFNTAGLPNGGGTGSDLFLAGDTRANEQVGLTALHTLFVREHNRLADSLVALDPTLDDEALYQSARRIVGAQLQVITYNEFLPALLGSDMALAPYAGYDPDVNPTIANAFSAALFRVGHTMLPSELLRLDPDGQPLDPGGLALREAFFNPRVLQDDGIEPYLMGLAYQPMREVDTSVTPEVQDFLFGPPGAGGFDLAALNIQRGRDHGLPDYNRMRRELGLAPMTSFEEITDDPALAAALEGLYGSVDNIDPWVGALAEGHLPGSSVGELVGLVVRDQFQRLRDGDRFWYENDAFLRDNPQWMSTVASTTLAGVINRNTGLVMAEDVFFLPQAVPVPGTLWLLGLGLLAWRRRQP